MWKQAAQGQGLRYEGPAWLTNEGAPTRTFKGGGCSHNYVFFIHGYLGNPVNEGASGGADCGAARSSAVECCHLEWQ